MRLGRVVGNVVSTKKDERLVGQKLLVVKLLEPVDGGLRDASGDGSYCVAVDVVGAGVGELVLLCSGSSARAALGDDAVPVDDAIVGIVDWVDVG